LPAAIEQITPPYDRLDGIGNAALHRNQQVIRPSNAATPLWRDSKFAGLPAEARVQMMLLVNGLQHHISIESGCSISCVENPSHGADIMVYNNPLYCSML